MSDAKDYFYAVGGERKGPVKFDELKKLAVSGELNRGDKIWHKGMAAWELAGKNDQLFADLPPDLEDESPGEPPPLEDIPKELNFDPRDWRKEKGSGSKMLFRPMERKAVAGVFLLHIAITALGYVVAAMPVSGYDRSQHEFVGGVLIAVGGILYVGGFVQYLIIHYRFWSAIPKEIAATTPGLAIGLLFVPIFNLYWYFVSFYSLAKNVNQTLEERGIKSDRVNAELAIAMAICLLMTALPTVGLFAVVGAIIFLLVYMRAVALALESLRSHEKFFKRKVGM